MVAVKHRADGVVVPVMVSAGASRNRLFGEHDGRLKLAVTAAPEKGKANEAVCKFLAGRLGVSKSEVHILSGHNSRLKEVLIEHAAPGALEAIIA